MQNPHPTDDPNGAAIPVAPATEETVVEAAEAVTVIIGPGPRTGPGALPQISRYEIKGMVANGRGGMGVVYRAFDTKLKREVALKIMSGAIYASPRERARFLIEAEATARLDHPGIMPIYDFGEDDEGPWFVMPVMEGGSLAMKLREAGKLVPAEAVALMLPICRATQHAHDRGVLHRDLKPANILLDDHGQPVVADFGLARMIGEGVKLTATGTVMGTPGYMPPEQARGNHVGTQADVYALGAVLYHLVSGRPPAEGKTPVETLRMVIEDAPVRPSSLAPDIDARLETIILKCLEKDEAHRYLSAAALAADLEAWQSGGAIIARRSSLPASLLKWAKRKPAWAAVAVVSVAGIVAFVVNLIVSQVRLRAERDATDAVRQSAENLVGTALTDYRHTVEANVGRLDALEQITDSVTRYFEGLPSRLRDERTELLHCRLRVLRGEVFTSLGRLPEAASALDQALEISRPYAAGPGAVWPLIHAAALVQRTNVALRQDDDAVAARLAADAVDSARKAVSTAPDEPEALRQLGLALFFHARTKVKEGQVEPATAAFAESMTAAEKVSAADPANLVKTREFVWSLVELAKLDKNRGAGLLADARTLTDPGKQEAIRRADILFTRATSLYDRARGILEPLIRSQPWNFPLRRDFGIVCDASGDCAKEWRHDLPSALTFYRQYLEAAKALVAHDSKNTEWLRENAVAELAVAKTLLESRQNDEAHPYYNEAIQLRRDLMAADPTNAKARREFCDALIYRSEARLVSGLAAGALADLTEGRDMVAAHAAGDSAEAWWENKEIAILRRLGLVTAHMAPDKPADAIALLELGVHKEDQLKVSGRLTAIGKKAGSDCAASLATLRKRSAAPVPPASGTPP